MTAPDMPQQWVVHPAMVGWLTELLNERGFVVVKGPPDLQGEDDLPTFFIFPKEMPR